MMIDWDKIRRDFPITKNSAYFQSAAMSPIPTPVFEAILEEYRKLHQGGDIKWMDDLKRYRGLCANLAQSINTEPDNVSFVPNTSLAMSLVALSLKNQLKKPFNIVSMKDEFPASTIGFEYLNLKMKYVEPIEGRYPIDSIIEVIDEQTVAVVTSQIQYATGFRQDLLALGRELHQRGILFIVNSTQAFPYFPVDVKTSKIDVLSASLHKWGLTGHVGSMFFTSPSFRERFPSPWAGWLSVDTKGKSIIHTAKNTPFRLHQSARRYDSGTFNLQPLLALQKALDYIQGTGLQNIQQRLMELTDYLIQGLRELNVTILSPVSRKEERSAIVTFTLGDKNEIWVKKLAEKNIYVSPRDGNIRVSVNIFNNLADIDRLLEVLRDLSI